MIAMKHSFLVVFLLHTLGTAHGYYSQICPVSTPVELVEVFNETTSQTEYHYKKTDQELGSNTTALFRECDCLGYEPFVCPYHTNLCAIPVNINDSTLCFEDDASTVLVRNIWPLVCLWYVFLCLLCFSYKGRHAITYCVQRCFPSTNSILVDRIMEHHQQIRQHYLNFWNANNPAANNEDECRELVLKTKEYHDTNEQTPGEEVDEDDPSTCCTICFVPLEEGDRIGALDCNHIFHVECIKGWVQRKNTCPLCAIPLATPRKKRNQRNQPAVAREEDNNV
jgi:hypothetical protein